MRSTTASVGDLEPRSYADSVGWEVPARRDSLLRQPAGEAGCFQERVPVHNKNISVEI